jgi:hypothetical protein
VDYEVNRFFYIIEALKRQVLCHGDVEVNPIQILLRFYELRCESILRSLARMRLEAAPF